MKAVTLHMTATQLVGIHLWVAYCRCGWLSELQPNQHEARKAGDRHLAEENTPRKGGADRMTKPKDLQLMCFNCNKGPDELHEYSQQATESSLSPDDYVWAEEGTLNRENGHFCCTECYIRIGMPSGSGPNRWVAP